MVKIPFDIKYRPQIESGEYKVITAKEQPVRIICWDRSTTYWKIIALILAPDGKTENPFTYDVNGKESDGCLHDHEFDLFLITPEPELTAFESRLCEILDFALKHKDTIKTDGDIIADAKRLGPELLDLARKELQPEKDLPRWKKAALAYLGDRLPKIDHSLNRVVARDENGAYYLTMDDLYKLPKEDEK